MIYIHTSLLMHILLILSKSNNSSTGDEVEHTASLFLGVLLLQHLKMSNGWERVRLRVETKEYLQAVKNANATASDNEITTISANMRTISSHVLDTSLGRAAANIPITIYRLDERKEWRQLHAAATDNDGRVAQLLTPAQYVAGIYKLHFAVRGYFEARGVNSFYPFIEIIVACQPNEHYHIPLLLNPYGYSTYRGT